VACRAVSQLDFGEARRRAAGRLRTFRAFQLSLAQCASPPEVAHASPRAVRRGIRSKNSAVVQFPDASARLFPREKCFGPVVARAISTELAGTPARRSVALLPEHDPPGRCERRGPGSPKWRKMQSSRAARASGSSNGGPPTSRRFFFAREEAYLRTQVALANSAPVGRIAAHRREP